MSMFEITSLLWRRRSIVAGIAAGVAVIGFALVLLTGSTTYTARAQILIDQPELIGNAGGASVPAKLAALGPTLCRLIDGDVAVTAIAERARLSTAAIRSDVGCRPIEGTTILEVSARSGSPSTSKRAANAAADALSTEVIQRYNGGDVPPREEISAQLLVAAPTPPRDSNHTVRELALVAFGALLLAMAFAVAAEPHRREATAWNDMLHRPPAASDGQENGSSRHDLVRRDKG